MTGRRDLELLTWTAAAAAVAVPVGYLAFSRRRGAVYEADFGNFLKHRPMADREPSDFNSFLRTSQGPGNLPAASSKPASDSQSEGHCQGELGDEDVQILVLYGTEYGFSKEVAEKAASDLATAPFRPKLVDMSDYPDGYPLAHEQAVLAICSTQGEGVPPTEARSFVEWLDSGCPSLPGVHFSVLALGDRSYTHFAACGKRIDATLEKLQAVRMHQRVDVHMEDWAAIDGWIAGVRDALPGLGLQPSKALGLPLMEAGDRRSNSQAAPRQGRCTWNNPFIATVTRVHGLCNLAEPGDKDTVQVELDLDTANTGITYVPGDALGVVPLNEAEAVTELLEVLAADAAAMVPVPARHYLHKQGKHMPAAEALQSCYDIRSPKPALLSELLAHMPADPEPGSAASTQMQHLRGLLETEAGRRPSLGSKQGPVEAYMSSRHVVDILQDFSAAHLPLEPLLTCLRPLQPRLYSISSSPLEAPGRVQVTVAVVRYESLRKGRVGVASTFLGERTKVGDRVAVYPSGNPDFRLPEKPEVPIIMVGPGTGLAPFRAFIQHRILEAAALSPGQEAAPLGPAMLFFGCRHHNRDYLYSDWLEGLARKGAILLYTAFSRDGPKKVYVQNRLLEAADSVWGLLEAGAHFYVCGDASRMAGDVEEALLDIIGARNGDGAKGAIRYLQAMKVAGRYQRDVWFS